MTLWLFTDCIRAVGSYFFKEGAMMRQFFFVAHRLYSSSSFKVQGTCPRVGLFFPKYIVDTLFTIKQFGNSKIQLEIQRYY